MKKIIIFLSFLIYTISLSAQDENSTIYLLDGSQLSGTIIEEKADDYIKLEIIGGNVISISFKDIDKLQRAGESVSQINQPSNTPYEVDSSVIVQLKNGGQEEGTIIEQLENAYIKLLRADGKVITIAQNDILSVNKKETEIVTIDPDKPAITTEKIENPSSNTNFLSAIQDIVYFKDGSRMQGEIIEEKEGEHIRLQTAENNIITIPLELIHKTKKVNRKNRTYYDKGRNVKKRGYYNVSMVGSIFGTDEFDGRTLGLSFQTINGYMFNRWIGVGGGVALDFYTYEFIPLFVDIRGYVMDKAISPYYSVNVGYGFGADLFNRFDDGFRDIEGGLMFHPSIGVRFATRYNSSFQVDVGYKFQDATITSRLPDFTEIADVRYQRFTLRFGWMF